MNEIIDSMKDLLPSPITCFEFNSNGTIAKTADGSTASVATTLQGIDPIMPVGPDYVPSSRVREGIKDVLINTALSIGATVEETKFDSPDFIYEVIIRKNDKIGSFKFNTRTSEFSFELDNCKASLANGTARMEKITTP